VIDFIRAGRSLLIYPRPDAKPHLWFVLTDPQGTPGRIVAVMVQSAKVHTDRTVMLMPGEHPFIRHETAVSFGTATFFTVEKLTSSFKKGTCHLRADMTDRLLQKVRAGLLASARTPNAIREFCDSRF